MEKILKALLVSADGMVVLRDEDSRTNQIAMTPAQASWLSHFLQQHLQSELIVQLRLASIEAESQRTSFSPEESKIFPLKRS